MSEDVYIKQRRQIIENLDVLIGNKEWEESLALKVIQGRIITYRDSLEAEIKEYEASHSTRCEVTKEVKQQISEDEIAVFVCLYRNYGDDMGKWAQALSKFSGNALGRPIYAAEAEAKKFMSSKVNREPEGYMEVWVKKDSILELPALRVMCDKFGSKLLNLKQGAISPKQIKYFTSGMGQKYVFNGSSLIAAE